MVRVVVKEQVGVGEWNEKNVKKNDSDDVERNKEVFF